MFNINDIYQDPYTSLYCCACQCTTEMDAKVLSAKLISPTNMLSNFSVQVGYVGTQVVLSGEYKTTVRNLAFKFNQELPR